MALQPCRIQPSDRSFGGWSLLFVRLCRQWLAFDIMRLNFWHGSERRATGVAEIGVQLILLSERRVLFEQTPPLIVSVRKSTPGGKEPMAPLCQEAATKIAQLLKDYLAQGHGGTP